MNNVKEKIMQNTNPLPVDKDLQFESNDQGTFIELGKFIKYLRDHEDHSDTSGIRKGNILRQVSKYKDGNRVNEWVEQLPVALVLRYMYQHMDDFKICKNFCSAVIESALGKQPTKVVRHNLSPYNDILACNFSNVQNLATADIYISNNDLEFIGEAYQYNFSSILWKKIQLFELHFQNYCKPNYGTSFEHILQRKDNFLNLCISSLSPMYMMYLV